MFTGKFPWGAPNDRVEFQCGLLLGQLFGLWGPVGPSGGPLWGSLEGHLGNQKAVLGAPGGPFGGPESHVGVPRGSPGRLDECFGRFGVHFGVLFRAFLEPLGRRFWVDI